MTMIAPMGEIGAFRFWCQKVLPAVYDDSLSYYELLAKVIEKLNEVIERYDASGSVINEILVELQALQKEFEEFKTGGLEEFYEELLDKWINENMPELIKKAIKMVFFGLTSEGYFCAYIPESWSDIIFDTGMVYNRYDYGRLILRYNVDGAVDVIDNTGRYDDSNTNAILERLNVLERRVFHNETTLYTNLG